MKIFWKQGDYLAFERVLAEVHGRVPVPILAWCLTPNHWHLVLQPRRGEVLSRFMRLLTVTHTQRWRAHTHTEGEGHLYQGRYKSFPVQEDRHLLLVCRYVERNALRANLVAKVQDWRWCSLWRRIHGDVEQRRLLADWPVEIPRDWVEVVNRPMRASEQEAIRLSVRRGRPYGEPEWQIKMARRHGLQHTFRDRGRPPKLLTEAVAVGKTK